MTILVSACLLGEPCRYDGKSKPNEKILELAKNPEHRIIPICPEVMGGLATPRLPAEIRDGEVIRCDGVSVDAEYRRGAAKVLQLAKDHQADLVILQSRSPSCGVKEHYDGTFSKVRVPGPGITAELLIKNGVPVQDVEDL